MTSPFWGWRGALGVFKRLPNTLALLLKFGLWFIATEIGPVENTLFEFFIARMGHSLQFFSNCLRKIALGFFSASNWVFSSPQKSSYWPMDSRKGHQLGGGFGWVSLTSGCIRGVFVRCRGEGGRNLQLFTKKSAFCSLFVKINQVYLDGRYLFLSRYFDIDTHTDIYI